MLFLSAFAWLSAAYSWVAKVLLISFVDLSSRARAYVSIYSLLRRSLLYFISLLKYANIVHIYLMASAKNFAYCGEMFVCVAA